MEERVNRAGKILRKGSATGAYAATGAVILAAISALLFPPSIIPLAAGLGGAIGGHYGAKKDLDI